MIQPWVVSRGGLPLRCLVERRDTGQWTSISLVSLVVVESLALSDISNRRIWAFAYLLAKVEVLTSADYWPWWHAEIVTHFILVLTIHGKALLPPISLTFLTFRCKLLQLLLNLLFS